MTKRVIFWLGASLLLCSAAVAQMKIGYVNGNILLEKAPQASAALTKLEQEFQARDAELQSKRDNIRAMEAELSKLGITETEQRERLKQDIARAQRELIRVEEDFRDDFNLRRNDELQKLQALIQEVIKSIQQDENFALILNQDAVAAASKEADITPLVLARLNELNQN